MSNASAATSTTAIAPGKSHYVVLDGLRGVASLLVVCFHLCEAHTFGNPFKQLINHGYLAVDFFFLLSGFVIAYAYDDRWTKMGIGEFFKRRLIRLQPMVVMGTVIGALLFYFGKGPTFPPIATTPVSRLILIALIGCTLIPITIPMDIRGWQEMHPLDGPAWSLFFEYIANILYALGLRKASNRVLGILVFLSALLLIHLTVFGPRGDVIGGWSISVEQLQIGFTRLLFPFLAGMLLMRLGRRIHVANPFAVAGLLLLVSLAIPRLGGPHHLWVNGIYESFCIIVLFPIIVMVGAGEKRADGPSLRLARFFGDLSYPLYITHYPLVYIYTAWIQEHRLSFRAGVLWGVVTLVVAIVMAYACLKLYDEPVRRWLSRRFLARPA